MNYKFKFFAAVSVLGFFLAGLSAYAYGSSNNGTLMNMNTTGNLTSGWNPNSTA